MKGFADSAIAPELTWVLFEQLPATALLKATGRPPKPHYYVEVSTLRGALTEDATLELGAQITQEHERVGQELTGLIAAEAQLENRTRHVFRHSDVALIVVDYTLRITTPDGQRVDTQGTATNVLRHTPGHGWRMIIANPPGIA